MWVKTFPIISFLLLYIVIKNLTESHWESDDTECATYLVSHGEIPRIAVRLLLAPDSAGRWVVWYNDTEDTACLLESLPHLHLESQTQTVSNMMILEKQIDLRICRFSGVAKICRLRQRNGLYLHFLLCFLFFLVCSVKIQSEMQQNSNSHAIIYLTQPVWLES